MHLRMMLLASAIGLSLAVPALAEPPTGSRLGERVERDPMKKERESALGAQELARCLASKQTHTVRAFLSTLDDAENKRLGRAMDGEHECFNMTEGNDLVEGRMVTFPPDIFRGMLAEWVIKSDEQIYAALPALPRQITYSRPWYGVSGRDGSVDEMATCVTETDPRETLGLLKTVPYSDAEGTAFAALVPQLGACLRAGVKLTGNRQSLRAALADALYQRVANPGATNSAQTSDKAH